MLPEYQFDKEMVQSMEQVKFIDFNRNKTKIRIVTNPISIVPFRGTTPCVVGQFSIIVTICEAKTQRIPILIIPEPRPDLTKILSQFPKGQIFPPKVEIPHPHIYYGSSYAWLLRNDHARERGCSGLEISPSTEAGFYKRASICWGTAAPSLHRYHKNQDYTSMCIGAILYLSTYNHFNMYGRMSPGKYRQKVKEDIYAKPAVIST